MYTPNDTPAGSGHTKSLAEAFSDALQDGSVVELAPYRFGYLRNGKVVGTVSRIAKDKWSWKVFKTPISEKAAAAHRQSKEYKARGTGRTYPTALWQLQQTIGGG